MVLIFYTLLICPQSRRHSAIDELVPPPPPGGPLMHRMLSAPMVPLVKLSTDRQAPNHVLRGCAVRTIQWTRVVCSLARRLSMSLHQHTTTWAAARQPTTTAAGLRDGDGTGCNSPLCTPACLHTLVHSVDAHSTQLHARHAKHTRARTYARTQALARTKRTRTHLRGSSYSNVTLRNSTPCAFSRWMPWAWFKPHHRSFAL